MKKFNYWFGRSCCKGAVLTGLLACALASCEKAPDKPVPPQAPPRPEATVDISPSDFQNAVFTYSSSKTTSSQSGLSATIREHVSNI
ncbi:MAG: hypothetical protein V4632_20440 [Pseudomonadota bacterium]